MTGRQRTSAAAPERKLSSAEFFLSLLKARKDDPHAVYHCASACLNAARAVDYALRHELNDRTRYKTWLGSWRRQLTHQDQTYLKDLLKIRGEDIHGEGLPLSIVIDVSSTAWDTIIAGRFSGTGIFSDDAAELWEILPELSNAPSGTVMTVDYEIRGLGPRYRGYKGEDVVVACESFVELAARLLRDFRAFFDGAQAAKP